ncbi:MAG: DUF3718 domain-containing protein, partial [Kangiellaceae bacterium]|nr:DUF3718 domain-containing protein [Kangiellaceae bacterium]
KALKDARTRLINIYDDAKCQGKEIFEYAVVNRAEKVKQYILSRAGIEEVSKEVLKDPLKESARGKVAVVGKFIEPKESE